MTYTTIVADPPWKYNDRLRMSTVKRGAGDQYPCMPLESIGALGESHLVSNPLDAFYTVANHRIAKDAFLFLWVTNPFLLDGSGSYVCRAWGFEPKQLITWTKGRISDSKLILNIGMGHITRGCTEHVIVATHGKPIKLVKNKGFPNFLLEPRTRHSTKPETFYDGVETLAPGPYLDLFARRERPGWTCWGNEL